MLRNGISEYFVDHVDQFQSAKSTASNLAELASRFGFSHITYFYVSAKTLVETENAVITTYDKEWQERYFSMNYDEIDPVVHCSKSSFLPLHWSDIPRRGKSTQKFFGEAQEFGVSDQGITIPVRGTSGESALVSLTTDQSASEWDKYSKSCLSDLIYFSFLLHRESLKKLEGPKEAEPVRISRRERDVLQWAAMGKTSWETSQILTSGERSVSERTVEFYLRNAMAKLGAATKAQAVSKAIHQGHILADAYVQTSVR